MIINHQPTLPSILAAGERTHQDLANTVWSAIFRSEKHLRLRKICHRDQLLKNRPERALRTLKSFPNFTPAFQNFVYEEARNEAEGILSDKDPPRSTFNLETIRKFSYTDQLAKLQASSPILVPCIRGSIYKNRGEESKQLSRKGFGGKNNDQDLDLQPAVVQSVTRIMRNRHPRSLTTLSCLNSMFLWTSRVSGHVFQFFNSLGDCYRYNSWSFVMCFKPSNITCNTNMSINIVELFTHTIVGRVNREIIMMQRLFNNFKIWKRVHTFLLIVDLAIILLVDC